MYAGIAQDKEKTDESFTCTCKVPKEGLRNCGGKNQRKGMSICPFSSVYCIRTIIQGNKFLVFDHGSFFKVRSSEISIIVKGQVKVKPCCAE